MGKRKTASDGDRESIIAGFTRENFERLNRFAHAKSLHSIIKCTKWLNYHGLEILRNYPEEFSECTGMTVDEYVRALSVHIDSCRSFVERMERLRLRADPLGTAPQRRDVDEANGRPHKYR